MKFEIKDDTREEEIIVWLSLKEGDDGSVVILCQNPDGPEQYLMLLRDGAYSLFPAVKTKGIQRDERGRIVQVCMV